MFRLMTPVLLKIEHFFVPLSHCHPCRAAKWNNLPNVFYKDLINYIRFVFLRYFASPILQTRVRRQLRHATRQQHPKTNDLFQLKLHCTTTQQMREGIRDGKAAKKETRCRESRRRWKIKADTEENMKSSKLALETPSDLTWRHLLSAFQSPS